MWMRIISCWRKKCCWQRRASRECAPRSELTICLCFGAFRNSRPAADFGRVTSKCKCFMASRARSRDGCRARAILPEYWWLAAATDMRGLSAAWRSGRQIYGLWRAIFSISVEPVITNAQRQVQAGSQHHAVNTRGGGYEFSQRYARAAFLEHAGDGGNAGNYGSRSGEGNRHYGDAGVRKGRAGRAPLDYHRRRASRFPIKASPLQERARRDRVGWVERTHRSRAQRFQIAV